MPQTKTTQEDPSEGSFPRFVFWEQVMDFIYQRCCGLLASFLILGLSLTPSARGEESVALLLRSLPQTTDQQKGARPGNRIESILQNVKPGDDGWLTELYDEELKVLLGELKKQITHRPFDAKPVSSVISNRFRGTTLRPKKGRLVRGTSPTVFVYQLDEKKNLSVTSAQLPALLKDWLDEFAEISYQELKTTGIELLATDPPEVRVPLRYSFIGKTQSGESLQLTGHWTTGWLKHPARGWLWTHLALEDGWESRAARPVFTDVSACKLPPGPALEQLVRGVDWWTANLDSATGMLIQGHNGLAVADIDGDGHEDFYLCQGSGLPNRLFRNRGDGTFEDFSFPAGLDILDRVSGAVFSDYDNDGDPDLLLTGSELLLFENNGTGGFTYLDSASVGLQPKRDRNAQFFSTCVSDYDRDGWLDIYVCSYATVFVRSDQAIPTPYHNATNGAPNFLFRNNGDGTFTDVTAAAGLETENNRFSFSCSWADYDRNGHPDLYVANDYGRNSLYRNNGDGTFTETAAEAGVEDIAAGMSVTWRDFNNDGWLDLYVGNMYSTAGLRTTAQPRFQQQTDSTTRSLYRRHARGNSLFRNRGDGTFEDISESAGVTMGRWAWSSNFVDFDLDGLEDIYVVNGYVTNESTHDL